MASSTEDITHPQTQRFRWIVEAFEQITDN